MLSFPFGSTLSPEISFGGPCGRGFYCVDLEILRKINKHHRKFRTLNWGRMTGWVWDAERQTGRGELVVLKVIQAKCGWWHVRLWDEGAVLHDLCIAFTDLTALFPTKETAMEAGDIYSSGQHWDIAPFVWINKNDNWLDASLLI